MSTTPRLPPDHRATLPAPYKAKLHRLLTRHGMTAGLAMLGIPRKRWMALQALAGLPQTTGGLLLLQTVLDRLPDDDGANA